MSDLEKIRANIDKIDEKLILLLEKRLHLALATKKYKKKISDRRREEKILKKISSSEIKEIYKLIFKIGKRLQNEL